MLLSDRICVITGAASRRGIGRAMSRVFAQHGGKVIILDLDETQAGQAASDLGAGHAGFACDVTNRQACLDVAERSHSRLRPHRLYSSITRGSLNP